MKVFCNHFYNFINMQKNYQAHFEDHMWEKPRPGVRRLKSDAVPTIFIPSTNKRKNCEENTYNAATCSDQSRLINNDFCIVLYDVPINPTTKLNGKNSSTECLTTIDKINESSMMEKHLTTEINDQSSNVECETIINMNNESSMAENHATSAYVNDVNNSLDDKNLGNDDHF